MASHEKNEPERYKDWRKREKDFLAYLEDVTMHPQREQETILKHILQKNAQTVFLQQFGLDGATDVDSFQKCVPVSDYDSYKEYVDRIVQGDKSPLLSGDPVVEVLTSSGTSGGEPKLFPVTAEELELRGLAWSLPRPLLNRAIPGLEKGKVLFFYFVRAPTVLQGGLLCSSAVTSFVKSSCFKQRPYDPSYALSSPDEVIECTDAEAAMYCHLLLGLLQREEVLRFGAIFASLIPKAVLSLQKFSEKLCEDITNGTLSCRVKDKAVRSAVLPMLRKDRDLAHFLRSEFLPGKSLDGIIGRLWPNLKVIDTICTGSMEAYLPTIANYSGNLPVICTQHYAASEGYFGINVDPMSPAEETSYTLLPFGAFYEFIAVSAGCQEKLGDQFDLLSLKEGHEYEILVTTVSGLYRYRLGDILKCVGFYNSSPMFQFMRRKNIILSIEFDKTDEKQLHMAVSRGTQILEEKLGLRLLDYTSTADMLSAPGHYVLFWELVPSSRQAPTRQLLELCCSVMEATLDLVYRQSRNEGSIGALELRLVQQGTFDLLAQQCIARGANLSQYKTPRSVGPKNPAHLEILNSGVYQTVFSQERPPLNLSRLTLSSRRALRESSNGRAFPVEKQNVCAGVD